MIYIIIYHSTGNKNVCRENTLTKHEIIILTSLYIK